MNAGKLRGRVWLDTDLFGQDDKVLEVHCLWCLHGPCGAVEICREEKEENG